VAREKESGSKKEGGTKINRGEIYLNKKGVEFGSQRGVSDRRRETKTEGSWRKVLGDNGTQGHTRPRSSTGGKVRPIEKAEVGRSESGEPVEAYKKGSMIRVPT